MALSAVTLITLLSASSVFATTTTTTNSTTTQVQQNQVGGKQNGFQTVLDNLVSASTITQDQETAVLNTLKPSGAPKGNNGFTTSLDSLVTAGTITSAQETAIQTALKNAAPSGVPDNGHINDGPNAGPMRQ